MEQNKKPRNFIKTTTREFLNEQKVITQHHDLFEYYEEQPVELKAVVDKYLDMLESGDYEGDTYQLLKRFHDEVYEIGYTFDSGLDAQPYGLRTIGIKLNQLKGW